MEKSKESIDVVRAVVLLKVRCVNGRLRLECCGRIPFGLVVRDAEDSVLQSWCPSESIFCKQ